MSVMSALGAASSIKRLPSRFLNGKICRVVGLMFKYGKLGV